VRLVLTRQLLGGEPLPWQLHRLQALRALWGPVVASCRAGGLTQKETRVHQQLAGSFSSFLSGHVLTFHTSFSALVLAHTTNFCWAGAGPVDYVPNMSVCCLYICLSVCLSVILPVCLSV
jgi:hypothetical protein